MTAATKSDDEPGTLADFEIQREAENGRLISQNFLPKNIKQACYELRASEIYYVPPDPSSRKASSGQIVIPPGQLVVIITLESVHLPPNVLGRILSKGQLFSIGISPVNTYADPGFSGRLGIALQNNSREYIKIVPSDAIAKIEFCRMRHPVQSPYGGQHGYETKIWPIPVDNLLRGDALAAFKEENKISKVLDEVRYLHGDQVYFVLKRVFQYERRLLLFSVAFSTFAASALLLPNGSVIRDNLVAFGLGILGNIAAAFLIYFATNVRGK
jgi:dCTP deaminase